MPLREEEKDLIQEQAKDIKDQERVNRGSRRKEEKEGENRRIL